MLVNETISLLRKAEEIFITGTDDVHTFETPESTAALRETGGGFKIALVHSPELADVASDALSAQG